MATDQGTMNVTATAGSAVTRYRIVTLAADGKYDHTTAATQRPAGIAAEAAAADGDSFSMVVGSGVAKVEVGTGGVSAGDELVSDTTIVGTAITGSGINEAYVIGVARETVGVGGIVEFDLNITAGAEAVP